MSAPTPFPPLYDAHHKLRLEDLPFWMELAIAAGEPILELGCGTGRVSLPLASAGYTVYALDRDASMLAWLQSQTLLDLPGNLHLMQADFTRLPFSQPFPLIIMPCNTCSMLTQTQRGEMLKQVALHLLPGGIFAASLPNPEILRSQPLRAVAEIEEVFLHPVDGNPVQVSSEWRRLKSELIVTWHYDHLLPDGRVNRFSAQVRHSLQSVSDYLREIQDAGLHLVDLYGDFERHEYLPQAEHLIIIAQRNATPENPQQARST